MTNVNPQYKANEENLKALWDHCQAEAGQALKDFAVKNGLPIPAVRDEDGGYDVLSRLLKDRIVLAMGGVDAGMMVSIVAQLKFLEAVDAKKEIIMMVNSPGGSVIDGLAIYDTMRNISCPITTFGIGMQASMGSILMAGGDKRVMSPNAKLLVHSLSSGTQGTYADQALNLDFSERLFDDLKAVYVARLGFTPEFCDLFCAQDTWLTADQAIKIGYIHGVSTITDPEVAAKKADPYASAAQAFLKAKQDTRVSKVAGLSSDELIRKLTMSKKEDAELRPEIITELGSRPESWVAERRAKAGVSNDNIGVTKAKKTGNGPKN